MNVEYNKKAGYIDIGKGKEKSNIWIDNETILFQNLCKYLTSQVHEIQWTPQNKSSRININKITLYMS